MEINSKVKIIGHCDFDGFTGYIVGEVGNPSGLSGEQDSVLLVELDIDSEVNPVVDIPASFVKAVF